MLPWWGWLLFWVVLVVGSGALLARLSWRVWGKATLLMAEVERAGASLAVLEARAGDLREVPSERSAATQDAHRVREEYRRHRAEAAAARRARRAGRLPPWARVH